MRASGTMVREGIHWAAIGDGPTRWSGMIMSDPCEDVPTYRAVTTWASQSRAALGIHDRYATSDLIGTG